MCYSDQLFNVLEAYASNCLSNDWIQKVNIVKYETSFYTLFKKDYNCSPVDIISAQMGLFLNKFIGKKVAMKVHV